MAREPKMIYCRKCGTQFNKKCNRCPQCGKRNKKPLFFRGWFIFLVIIVVAFTYFTNASSKGKTPSYNNAYTSSNSSENKYTPSTKPESKVPEPSTTETQESATSTTEVATEAPTDAPQDIVLVDGMRPEFKEAMDAYEEFYMEYCDILEEYSKNPTNLTLMSKYFELLEKAQDMDEAFSKWENGDLNTEELKYYLEVSNRVMQRLLEVSG